VNCTDGAYPLAGLIQATDGNFYGTAYAGGVNGNGTAFKITPAGTLTTLYSFCSQANCGDGETPYAALVQGTDGNFYGTTYAGGSSSNCNGGCGTVFKITSANTLSTLHGFAGTDGSAPYAALVQAIDGNFYGTTEGGGTNGYGTVFKITPGGTLTTLYSFCSQTNCGDGAYPLAGLIQATDGNFYGTTEVGGTNGYGTVFKITPGGTLTTLYSFCSQTNCGDGASPLAGLIQATDGNFYGTTDYGGTMGYGAIFSLSGAISPNPLQFVPVAPCRLYDTRTQYGGNGPIQGGTF
jgi:uncharacterized repeat protein (TIGR03803 family)